MENYPSAGREEGREERGECEGSVSCVDESASAPSSAAWTVDQPDDVKIQNFLDPAQGSIYGNHSQEFVKDQDVEVPPSDIWDSFLMDQNKFIETLEADDVGVPLFSKDTSFWTQQGYAITMHGFYTGDYHSLDEKLKQAIAEGQSSNSLTNEGTLYAPNGGPCEPLAELEELLKKSMIGFSGAQTWPENDEKNTIYNNHYSGQSLLLFGQNVKDSKLKQVSVDDQNSQDPTQDLLANYLSGSSSHQVPDAENSMENVYFGTGDFWDEEYTEQEDDYDYDDYDHGHNGHESNLNTVEGKKIDNLDLLPGVEAKFSWWKELISEKKDENSTEDEIDIKYKDFKQFDTIQDYSDHHFFKSQHEMVDFIAKKPPKEWVKTIQHEWKILERDLPKTILVRVYEERMDLLRAVIIGSPGTPYHDGLFFFDCCFPSSYPTMPPMVHYHSGGLRLNPNLYASGKVCLSLLGTWNGDGCERWNPKESTMLQVLVSIQALVLNSNPFFNEPGYESLKNTIIGVKRSSDYNDQTFLLSCKTMLYSIRRPLKNFEDLIAGYFREQGRCILIACRAYMDGLKVGSVIGDNGPEMDGTETKRRPWFETRLNQLFEELLTEFALKGVDCCPFIRPKVNPDDVDTSLRLGL